MCSTSSSGVCERFIAREVPACIIEDGRGSAHPRHPLTRSEALGVRPGVLDWTIDTESVLCARALLVHRPSADLRAVG